MSRANIIIRALRDLLSAETDPARAEEIRRTLTWFRGQVEEEKAMLERDAAADEARAFVTRSRSEVTMIA